MMLKVLLACALLAIAVQGLRMHKESFAEAEQSYLDGKQDASKMPSWLALMLLWTLGPSQATTAPKLLKASTFDPGAPGAGPGHGLTPEVTGLRLRSPVDLSSAVDLSGARWTATNRTPASVLGSGRPEMIERGSKVRVLRPDSYWFQESGTVVAIDSYEAYPVDKLVHGTEGAERYVVLVRFDKMTKNKSTRSWYQPFALDELVEVEAPPVQKNAREAQQEPRFIIPVDAGFNFMDPLLLGEQDADGTSVISKANRHQLTVGGKILTVTAINGVPLDTLSPASREVANSSASSKIEASALTKMGASRVSGGPPGQRLAEGIVKTGGGGPEGIAALLPLPEVANSSVSSKIGASASSKMGASHVSMKQAGQQFRACLSSTGDVNIASFMDAAEQYVHVLENCGTWTARGIDEVQTNLRVLNGVDGNISSMIQLLKDQLRCGARKPRGGPVSGSGAEAVLWLRLDIGFWVEAFKERLRKRKVPLRQALIHGYEHSMGPYVNRAAKMAFRVGSRVGTPDWDVIRQGMDLGDSEEKFIEALQSFVKDLEPVLKRMAELQKEFGLDTSRTLSSEPHDR